MIRKIVRKIVEVLLWHYEEQKNWEMKMNEPIAIRKVSKEEAREIILQRKREIQLKTKTLGL